MKLNIQKVLAQFLTKRNIFGANILVAFSGGVDSWALVHSLMNVSGKFDLKISLAHVDHNWRKESETEAKVLKEWAAKNGIPFYLKRLNMSECCGNAENYCRNFRIQFFLDLAFENNISAIFLGHHGDDQNETVLKRIFEGAAIPNLCGLSEAYCRDNIYFYRPLLSLSKKELENYVEGFEEKPFYDVTNANQKYLRARMRTTILPSLESQFGKRIGGNLQRLARDSLELKCYLDSKVSDLWEYVEKDRYWGIRFRLARVVDNIELRWFLKNLLDKQKSALPRVMLDRILFLLKDGSANKRFYFESRDIVVDRGRLFVFEQESSLNTSSCALEDGAIFMGWRVSITDNCGSEYCGWGDLWQNNPSMAIPKGDYKIGLILNSGHLKHKKMWYNKKIPAFLHDRLPVIYNEDGVYDFLDIKNIVGEKQYITLTRV